MINLLALISFVSTIIFTILQCFELSKYITLRQRKFDLFYLIVLIFLTVICQSFQKSVIFKSKRLLDYWTTWFSWNVINESSKFSHSCLRTHFCEFPFTRKDIFVPLKNDRLDWLKSTFSSFPTLKFI